MKSQFAARMANMQKSFIREVAKITQNPEVISFAGGLPNPKYFPTEALRRATHKVLLHEAKQVLQYAPTMGHLPLRQFIAERYAQQAGIMVDPEEVLLTNGAQQSLDLIGKILLDEGDGVLLESPSYSGGIMALALYQPTFNPVPLLPDGVDTAILAQKAQGENNKLFYALPNFQNPTGISYSAAKRHEVARILQETSTFFIEDDPYRELRFAGENLPLIASYGRSYGFVLGSFSKIVAPGLRVGWVVAAPNLMEKLIIAKQAADLHSSYLPQQIIHQFLLDNDLEAHIKVIKEAYCKQRDLMVSSIEETFPPEIKFTLPEGGMFLWLTLPPGLSAMTLFAEAVKRNVVFVPGGSFHVDGQGSNCLRLNFSNTDESKIRTGMKRLAQALRQLMART